MGSITTVTGSGETMDMMLIVRGCTVDLHPVAAVDITGTTVTVQDFKARPVILLKASPDPLIASGVDIDVVGEGDAHLHLDIFHRHHRLLRT